MSAPNHERVHAFMVTFHRSEATGRAVEALLQQSRPPDTLLVVNNGPVGDVAHLAELPGVRVLDAGDNVGPAGGWALAIDDVLRRAADDDWMLIADDDTPPPSADTVADIIAFGNSQRALDPSVAGVGLVGGLYDRRRGQVARIADEQLHGAVDVDTLGGGHWPLLHVGSIRNVELPDARLFFGFEELEYFLKVRGAGLRLVTDGDQWKALRERANRTNVARADMRGAVLTPWRAYYSTRNEVVIGRRNATRIGVWRAVERGLARTARSLGRRDISSARANAIGTFDGCFGRLGRRREPPG